MRAGSAIQASPDPRCRSPSRLISHHDGCKTVSIFPKASVRSEQRPSSPSHLGGTLSKGTVAREANKDGSRTWDDGQTSVFWQFSLHENSSQFVEDMAEESRQHSRSKQADRSRLWRDKPHQDAAAGRSAASGRSVLRRAAKRDVWQRDLGQQSQPCFKPGSLEWGPG